MMLWGTVLLCDALGDCCYVMFWGTVLLCDALGD